ncbi:MAG: hypothetical protein ACLFQP_03455 [Halothece sp.]
MSDSALMLGLPRDMVSIWLLILARILDYTYNKPNRQPLPLSFIKFFSACHLGTDD